MGLEFKPKLSAILAAIHGTSIAISYIVTKGDITAMIIWFAISTGVTAGSATTRAKKKQKNKPKNQGLNQNVNNFTQNMVFHAHFSICFFCNTSS